jgi:hypothetical protein
MVKPEVQGEALVAEMVLQLPGERERQDRDIQEETKEQGVGMRGEEAVAREAPASQEPVTVLLVKGVQVDLDARFPLPEPMLFTLAVVEDQVNTWMELGEVT